MKAFRQIILFLIFVFGFLNAGGADYVQKKKTKFDFQLSSQEKTEEVYRLIKTGTTYLSKSKSKFRDVKEYIDSAYLICINEGIETPSSLHLLYAEYYFRIGNYKKASEEASVALKKADASNDDDDLAKALLFMGSYYLKTSFFMESLQNYENSISLAEESDLTGIKPEAYYGKSKIYDALKDLKNRKISLEKMIESATVEKDTTAMLGGYYLLGTLVTGPMAEAPMRDFKAADSLLRIAYSLAVMHKDSSIATSALANMGWNFYLTKMYDPALSNYKKSLTYSIPAKIHSAAANAYGNIGNVFRDLGDTERSITYYKKAIEQAEPIKDWYSLEWVYKDMSDMYLRLKDTAMAFRTFILHKQFNDSLLIFQRVSDQTVAQLRYETETNLKEVELLSLRIKNQRLMLYGFSGLIVLLLVIGLLLFRASRIRKIED